jgi:heme exporter protein D
MRLDIGLNAFFVWSAVGSTSVVGKLREMSRLHTQMKLLVQVELSLSQLRAACV